MPTIRRIMCSMLLSLAAIFSSLAFGQDTTAGGASYSDSANSTSASGNSTFSSDSTSTAPSPATQAPASANVTSEYAAQFAAVQKQKQQLAQQYIQQVAAATPEARAALVNAFQQQIARLNASVQLPVPTPEQLAQRAAALAALLKALPAAAQQTFSLLRQRTQLTQQLANATPDQQAALNAQIQDLLAQQAALKAVAPWTPPNAATIEQAQATWLATLPGADPAALSARSERSQAIQSALQLPPEQRAAALRAVLNQPLPESSANATGAADTISGNGTPTIILSTPPAAGQ